MTEPEAEAASGPLTATTMFAAGAPTVARADLVRTHPRYMTQLCSDLLPSIYAAGKRSHSQINTLSTEDCGSKSIFSSFIEK